MDNPVIRDPITGQPYIPGSSLRGKMRALLDRHLGNKLNKSIGRDVKIHECKNEDDYANCPVCKLFGLPGDAPFAEPARLIVRDTFLKPESAEKLVNADTDMPYTEIKWEVAIDRITSAANPRQNERVPAGAVFAPLEMIFSFYDLNEGGYEGEMRWLEYVLTGMELIEDDYLGGTGSRGSGKVRFNDISLTLKPRSYYEGKVDPIPIIERSSVPELRRSWDEIVRKIREGLQRG